jgi:carbon storage regulator CsrA
VKLFLQAQDDSVVINGDITVTVLKIEGEEVILGIDAPQWVSVEESPQSRCETACQFMSLPR